MKKKIVALFASLSTFAALTLPASAQDALSAIGETPVSQTDSAEQTQAAPPKLGLFWSGISYIVTDISFDSSGNANCYANVYSYYSNYKIYASARLERLDGSRFVYVSSWSSNGTSAAYISGSTRVRSGTYRLVITGSVYDGNGNFVETINDSSSLRVY